MTRLRKMIDLHQAVNRGRRARGEDYVPSLLSAMHLALFKEFAPKEIVNYALYSPKVRADLPVLISKQASLAKLRRGNPHRLQHKTENKVEFYRICESAGLPVPRFLGLISRTGGAAGDGTPLEGEAAWANYIDREMPGDFITKDVAGAYASGFATYAREGDRFIDETGTSHDAAGVYRRMLGTGRDLLIQERLFDHPALARLCGRRTLQCLRLTTRRRPSGEVDTLFYIFKMVCGENIADNFSGGKTGNVLAWGSQDPMVLRSGFTAHSSGAGLAAVDRHPDTGISFVGLELPYWREANELVARAHDVFAEFESIGWDVALTASGPKLLEANAWWDPPTYAPHIMSREHWRELFG